LAKIHIAAKQLRLDEDVYRSIVRRVSAKFRDTPVESSAKLNAHERAALIPGVDLVWLQGRTAAKEESQLD